MLFPWGEMLLLLATHGSQRIVQFVDVKKLLKNMKDIAHDEHIKWDYISEFVFVYCEKSFRRISKSYKQTKKRGSKKPDLQDCHGYSVHMISYTVGRILKSPSLRL